MDLTTFPKAKPNPSYTSSVQESLVLQAQPLFLCFYLSTNPGTIAATVLVHLCKFLGFIKRRSSYLVPIHNPNFSKRLLRHYVPESNHGLEELSGMHSQLTFGNLHVRDRLKHFDAYILEKEV